MVLFVRCRDELGLVAEPEWEDVQYDVKPYIEALPHEVYIRAILEGHPTALWIREHKLKEIK